jgi:DNA/RNA-binding domain of Phe-tRNA-synthetase-like protein
MLQSILSLLALRYPDMETAQIIEGLSKTEPFLSWRGLFTKMGLSSSSFRSSVEALVRRSVRDGKVPVTGIKIVDLYNALSVHHAAPLGGHDCAKVTGPVTLRFADNNDHFTPLGGKASDFPLKPTVLVYAREGNILGFALNCRDSADYCLTDETDEALFVSEALNDAQEKAAVAALNALAEILQNGGASVNVPIKIIGGEPNT